MVHARHLQISTEDARKFAPQLQSIANQSFDLLAYIQKLENMWRIRPLSPEEKSDIFSLVRLVGLMIHILEEFHYKDGEMMDTLVKRYQKIKGVAESAAA